MLADLGQGVNAALLDVHTLAATLAQHDGDVREALLAYERTRLPEIRALMTLTQARHSVSVTKASLMHDLLRCAACVLYQQCARTHVRASSGSSSHVLRNPFWHRHVYA
jgi:2-polyprenyl-6-methoxyphenol hydroxylase-like FAD-dependent oxidoreductase